MRKLTRRVLTAIAVAATTVALTTVPASAAPLTISPGGPFTGINSGPVGIFLIRGAVVCQQSTITGIAGPVDFQFNNVTFSTPGNPNNWCGGSGFGHVEVTPLALPWELNVMGATTGGVTPVRLEGVKIQLNIPSIGCTAVVAGPGGSGGYIAGEHTNPAAPGDPSRLSLQPTAPTNLGVTDIPSGPGSCPAILLQLGDKVAIAATYDLTPGQTIS